MARVLKHVSTPFGEIAYGEGGAGQPALFVHGILLNGYFWRNVISQVADLRKCIAIDILGHGGTQTKPGQDIGFSAQADMLAAFCDAMGFDQVDVVSNDSGGGIAQIFAARHQSRIRSLTLTNCDVHDNFPPPALEPLMTTVREGKLSDLGRGMIHNLDFARQTLAVGYQFPQRLSAETVRTYFEPLFATPERVALLEQFFNSIDSRHNVAAEAALKTLAAPTLIVWGTGDVFFDVKWAHWLKNTIPGAREPVILDGAKLFFPEERPEELVKPLRALWTAK